MIPTFTAPMQARHIDSFDGTRLHSRIEGPPGAPVVVLSHSIGCDFSSWDSQIEAFTREFQVVRFDRRGHGLSDSPPGPYTLDMLGRDALAVLDGFDVPRAHYVGLSQGGMEAMWLGTRAAERVDHLVIANSAVHIATPERIQASIDQALAEGMTAVAASTLSRWLSAEFRAAQPERAADLERVFAATTPHGFAGCMAVLLELDERENVKRIAAPTLVITGGAEQGAMQASAEAIAHSIPHARFLAIPGAAHLSSYENPAAFNAAVLEFLAT